MPFYSRTTHGFYLLELHGDAIPSDAVEISAEYHAELLEAQAKGKRIAADESGCPIAIDRPEPTDAEKDAIRVTEIKGDLAAIDAASSRPARAVALALASGKTPDAFDVKKLSDLDAQAVSLRAELKTLSK